ncbi:phosphoribosylamine--glycine ligase [Helicobacter trogontum]|uniref:Phosphoribosylamine--glycine ligase n=1 Tax=Helicobacter trogontum TaxID=50960 RepID=A0A4U8SAM8_9HELI|nr:phosphoribosylamine--glycine ligase [Helicobacter trogontum]TLD83138.1 phosphoribosylamine--glycine ligase [Helicobacter trogontum]
MHNSYNTLQSIRVLIIGNGGREYSIALALQQDKKVKQIFFSPENPAATLFFNAGHFSYSSHDELLAHIQTHKIDFVIIGPEAPLMQGISDFLVHHNILVFGPSYANAKLEGSKAYMKSFIHNLGIPTAKYKEITQASIEEGYDFIDTLPLPIVLKASGLCGGKGVLILDSKEEAKNKLLLMLEGKLFGDAGKEVVIEEFLDGYELSVFALSNGSDYVVLPACQDHKRLLDDDKGPNTGGMGAYTNLPAKLYNKELETKIKDKILTPTFDALKKMGTPYKGVIFAGIMVVKNEPYLLEYNVRFGDPECEVLMPLLKTSALELMYSYAKGESLESIIFNDICVVCVVMSSSDYVQDSKSSDYPAKISFDNIDPKNITADNGHLVFANTSLKDSILYANSGRSIVAVGKGKSLKEARDNAYALVEKVDFKGKHYRRDIAYQALQ